MRIIILLLIEKDTVPQRLSVITQASARGRATFRLDLSDPSMFSQCRQALRVCHKYTITVICSYK